MDTNAKPSALPPAKMGEFDIVRNDIEFHGDSIKNYLHRKDEALCTRIAEAKRHVVYGQCTTYMRAVADDRGANYNRPFSVKLSFHNYLGRDVFVMGRDGLPAAIPTEQFRHEHDRVCFIIRKELIFHDLELCKKAHAELASMGILNSSELKTIKSLLTRDTSPKFGRTIVSEYIIDEDEFDNTQQCVYHHKTDTLVYLKTDGINHRHPHSSEFIKPYDSDFAYFPKGANDMGVTLRYVSPDPNSAPKYVRVAGKTLVLFPEFDAPRKLIAVKQKNKEAATAQIESDEYIEIFYPAKSDSADASVVGFRCSRLTVEDAKMYHGVFDSAAEAESSADTYEARVRIMKERLDFEQLDRKKGNVEYENKIEELEQQLLDKDRRIEQLKNDRAAILEEARERRETNSHEQKMSVEHFKFTAIVVTTVLGMIPLLIKLSSKKTT